MTLIRELRSGDEPAWRRLWAGYIDFYQTELPGSVTDGLFKRLLKGEPHFALVVENEGEVIGFAHCLPHASTWSSDNYCYLEDLFVSDAARGTGAGRALIEAIYAEADRRGCARVYWNTEDGNVTARRLYDKLATVTDFVQYRR